MDQYLRVVLELFVLSFNNDVIAAIVRHQGMGMLRGTCPQSKTLSNIPKV